MRKNYNSGFTLIELLIVIVIMSLLFTVGYVNFRDFQQRQNGQSIARNIKSDLAEARNSAASGNKPAGCDILNGYKFTVTTQTQYTISATCQSLDIQTKVVNLPSGFTLSTPTPNPLIFKVLSVGTNIPFNGIYALTITQTALNTGSTIYVRSSGEIEEGAQGVTPAPTPTVAPTVTPKPTATPTPTPTKLPSGSKCTGNSDCQSGVCNLGICQ